MKRKIIVWYDFNNSKVYHRCINDFFDRYFIGYKNQYNHEVIDIVYVYNELIYKEPLKSKVIKRIIRFLQKYI